jgi:flavin reductase (DIM6/NTAB) family NADH-FMN oxidoreductase RutF
MPEAPSTIARALGRIPSGLYIVTTRDAGRPVGFLGSFVMQMGFEPPVVCVAVGRERSPLPAIRAHGHFALSILDAQSRGLMTPFLRRSPEGTTPFDDLALTETAAGCPVLTDALAWVGCRVTSEHETGDHVVVFGEVVEAELLREGEPHVHLRKNGLSY